MNDDKPAAPSSAELAALIEADKQRRAERAQVAIRAACEQYRVRLVGTLSVVGDKIETGVMVVPE